MEAAVNAWIPYPRTGTHFEDGRWLCTVEGAKHPVQILTLRNGEWERLPRRHKVVAVTQLPEPAGAAVRREAQFAARTRALLK